MEALRRQIRAYMRGHTMALLVQYKRYGHKGNLKRAFLTLPKYYASRMGRVAVGMGKPADILLSDEVMGYLSGFLYFMRHPRTELAFPPHAADWSTSGGARARVDKCCRKCCLNKLRRKPAPPAGSVPPYRW